MKSIISASSQIGPKGKKDFSIQTIQFGTRLTSAKHFHRLFLIVVHVQENIKHLFGKQINQN
jgi:hypothetical protein